MKQLLPLSRLPTGEEIPFDPTSKRRLDWRVDLPAHVDQDRMLFDVAHFRRLQALSNSVFTQISTLSEAKTAAYDISIHAANLDGTATMGIVKKIKEAEPSQRKIIYQFSDPTIRSEYDYGTFAESHALNKPQMVSDVSDLRQTKGMSSEVAWAHTLDTHIQASLRQTAKEVLYQREEGRKKRTRNYEFGYYGLLVTMAAVDFTIGNTEDGLLLSIVYHCLIKRSTL